MQFVQGILFFKPKNELYILIHFVSRIHHHLFAILLYDMIAQVPSYYGLYRERLTQLQDLATTTTLSFFFNFLRITDFLISRLASFKLCH